jgi:hypothetical protein
MFTRNFGSYSVHKTCPEGTWGEIRYKGESFVQGIDTITSLYEDEICLCILFLGGLKLNIIKSGLTWEDTEFMCAIAWAHRENNRK